jgi:hypothetical protein
MEATGAAAEATGAAIAAQMAAAEATAAAAAAGAAGAGGGIIDVALGIAEVAGLALLAGGTDFAEGGTYIVGEEGPEILRIPRGSQVIPNGQARSMQQDTYSAYDQVNAIGALMQRQMRASLGIRGY